jgi:hypothetical protein
VKQCGLIIALIALALSASAIRSAPMGGRIATSLHKFRKNFGELRKVETMNPLERFMFSLALVNYSPKP